jgi:hypothetical protein
MKCRSGKHEWLDDTSAERCCSPNWFRATRWPGEEDDLDPEGRVYNATTGFIHGWVRLAEEVME